MTKNNKHLNRCESSGTTVETSVMEVEEQPQVRLFQVKQDNHKKDSCKTKKEIKSLKRGGDQSLTHKKEKKVSKIRHAEYYDMTEKLDELYERSTKGQNFSHLMKEIISRENILMAYRNLKKNKGSYTPGCDKRTIKDIMVLTDDELVETVRHKLEWYKPKRLKRVEIPKPNGKMRPLGIPSIDDRLIQQCILQILEPICEAKFYDHNYGFRPNRSVEHAIADVYRRIQLDHLTFVVDADIKGFFDNVNHSKLLRQMWTMGIHDKQLLCVIKRMLKAPIVMINGSVHFPTKGTPQGGILSPLLANIVLNELDWWIASQWEQAELESIKPKYNEKGCRHRSCEYRAMRKTKLKEMYIVRYADDFKIFCRKRTDADKVLIATKMWLDERLHLQTEKTKSGVTNLKKHPTEFLGFELRAVKKKNKWVVNSHMTSNAIAKTKTKLKEAIKKIQHPTDNVDKYHNILLYNSKVMGIHNYYRIATHISRDMASISNEINTVLTNRIKGLSRKGNIRKAYQKNYGKSVQTRYIGGVPIIPIGYCQTKKPMNKKRITNRYTPEGRAEIHKSQQAINSQTLRYVMEHPVKGRTNEYNDNRLSLFVGQYGKSFITGKELEPNDMHCHHKIAYAQSKDDSYKNLCFIESDVHHLIHATKAETILKYLETLRLDKKQLSKVNKLRKLLSLEVI